MRRLKSMHIIPCYLSTYHLLFSFLELHFMSVSAGYNCNNYTWSSCVDILIIYHNLYSISQTQWIIKPPNNASQPLPLHPPCSTHITADNWPTSVCCPSSPSDLYQKTLISLSMSILSNVYELLSFVLKSVPSENIYLLINGQTSRVSN